MTAATPPPPHDGEVCACGHKLRHHAELLGERTFCMAMDDGCLRFRTAPSPVGTTEPPAETAHDRETCTDPECVRVRGIIAARRASQQPPAETVEEMAARYDLPVELLNARVVFHPEPPAETQQDDERCSCPDDWMSSTWDGPRTVRGDHHLSDCPLRAFPARPSADTETLRRVRELADGFAKAGRPPILGDFDRGVAAAYADVARQLRAALDAR